MRVPVDPIDWDTPREDALARAYNNLLSFKFGPDAEYSNMILQRAAALRMVDIVGAIVLIHAPHRDMVQPYVHNYHPHFSVMPYTVSWIKK